MEFSVQPDRAWDPLPPADWNPGAVRHLLRRTGWSAVPAQAEAALTEGLDSTLERLFPAAPAAFPAPPAVMRLREEQGDRQRAIQAAAPEERRRLQREWREANRAALLELTIAWLRFAAQPEQSAFQKWVLFLSDVYVVAFDKVPRTALLYDHFDRLATYAQGPAPALTKAILRSPAMIAYLDLNQNQAQAPNENFARELFELFVLGEGNYSENDIKQAARAFTGYRLRPNGASVFAPRQHDDGAKTIFGVTGDFNGDEVIDLAYRQRAASAFLPHEMAKFYLSDRPLPPEYLTALGDRWRSEGGYRLDWLARAFFRSRLFFAPEFRAAFIKSPVHFYLGLVQDLGLDVLPAPRFVLNPLRQMGQVLYDPPNVRGWVGGRAWINSSSLAARRSLVESVFAPLNERALNQDELIEIVAARSEHRDVFTVADDRFSGLLPRPAAEAARHLTDALLPVAAPALVTTVAEYLRSGPATPADAVRRLRRAAVVLLQSPEYQLC